MNTEKCPTCARRIGSHTIMESLRCGLVTKDEAREAIISEYGDKKEEEKKNETNLQAKSNSIKESEMEQTKNTRVSVKGLMKYVSYDTSEEGLLSISWDYENDKVDALMSNEYKPKFGNKLNMMWIKKLIEVSGWVIGDSLYCDMKCNCDGWFYVWYSKEKKHNCYDLIIEPNGYVSRRYFNHYSMDEIKEDNIQFSMTIRTESVYNDWVCGEINKREELKKKGKGMCVGCEKIAQIHGWDMGGKKGVNLCVNCWS